MSYHPLPDFLALVVPFKIIELKRRGGPSDEELGQAREFADTLGEKGDIILYRSERKGETAQLFNQLARTIAVGSFLPGGICIFGDRYLSAEEIN